MIKKIRKRDETVVKFDKSKIIKAIVAANSEVEEIKDHKVIEELAENAVELLKSELKPNQIPTVEMVQDEDFN
jgi:anaerobic ribonucleoside-triphosphate reductase